MCTICVLYGYTVSSFRWNGPGVDDASTGVNLAIRSFQHYGVRVVGREIGFKTKIKRFKALNFS
tara:strand:+ start:695 stop:886 length:192 start_codon:yes stop_codon:yes gene_type:complete